jgi:PhnB protein
MARVSTYLNFMGKTEEAFRFYQSVFGTELSVPFLRLGDTPADPSGPQLSAAEQQLIMHVELPILAGHVLMGTDMVESMGHQLRTGNNVTINLEVDTRDEADRLYKLLSDGGTDGSGMQEMFWGYWGSCCDKYGVRWMVNVGEQVS